MIEICRSTGADENEYKVFSGVIDPADISAAASSGLCSRLILPANLQAYFELKDTASDRSIELIQYREGTGLWMEMKGSGRCGERIGDREKGSIWKLVVRNISSLTVDGAGTREAIVQIRSLEDLAVRHTSGTWWLPGDLHLHSMYSDGAMFPDALFSLGRENGLAFMALTDHQVFYPGDASGQPVRLSGIEITSSLGHFNCIGASGWKGLIVESPLDIPPLSCDWLRFMAQKWRSSGAVVIINHPCFEPWHWRCSNLDEQWFDAIEIICDPGHERSADASEKALKLWNSMLCKGWTVGGTGGSDFHDSPGQPGFPTTFIGCSSPLPDKDELLSAVRNGKTAVGCGFLIAMEVAVDFESDTLRWRPFVKAFDHPAAPAAFPLSCELIVCGTKAAVQVITSADGCIDQIVENFRKYLIGAKGKPWIRIDCRNNEGKLTGFSEVIRVEGF